MKDTSTLRAYLIDATAGAICVRPIEPKRGDLDKYWVPRSQIGYMRKTIIDDRGTTEIEFTLPEWVVEKKEMWGMVT